MRLNLSADVGGVEIPDNETPITRASDKAVDEAGLKMERQHRSGVSDKALDGLAGSHVPLDNVRLGLVVGSATSDESVSVELEAVDAVDFLRRGWVWVHGRLFSSMTGVWDADLVDSKVASTDVVCGLNLQLVQMLVVDLRLPIGRLV